MTRLSTLSVQRALGQRIIQAARHGLVTMAYRSRDVALWQIVLQKSAARITSAMFDIARLAF